MFLQTEHMFIGTKNNNVNKTDLVFTEYVFWFSFC